MSALLLAALRIPLAAQYPQPAELQAVRILLVAQFAFAALLFPWLLRNARMAIVAACGAGVLLLLAATLSGWEPLQVIPSAVFLVLWIALLALVAAALPPKGQMIAAGVASVYAIGGALIWYLQTDFGSASPAPGSLAYGPLGAVIHDPRQISPGAWWGIVGMNVAAILALALTQQARFRPSSRSV